MTMATQVWKVVRPHVIMIKFRKGGLNQVADAMGAAAATPSTMSGPTQSKNKSGATGPNVTTLPTIEDFQLPLRYRRQPLGDREIDYINRGGPE